MFEVHDLTAAFSRFERWTLPLAIILLFAYPNPLVSAALGLLAMSGIVRLVRGGLGRSVTPVDAWLGLLAAGTLIGLAVAHQPEAAMLRFTGVVAALGTYAIVRGFIRTERDIRLVGLALAVTVAVGVLVVLALLRGSLPESPVTAAIWPMLAPFSVFPGVSGDTLEVNARFTVHQYGLAHLLLVGALFAVAAVALGPGRRVQVGGLLVLVLTVVLLLATQARGAFMAVALAGTVVAAYRTRVAWVIPPAAA
ncbi:MAG: hypothetical protein AB7K36_11625, partial [Chloroflexota bacterium]